MAPELMTILLSSLPDSEIRSICKQKIESLEHWLRRLIDDALTSAYGDYFSYQSAAGDRLVKSALVTKVADRRKNEPLRYPRNIDAVLLEDAVDIICKPDLFNKHFKMPLAIAFPEGREEARTFLSRILGPRNNLAHANAISARSAEQILCYSNDVIESLNAYYRDIGMQQEYDSPLILRLTDSFGQTFTRAQLAHGQDSDISLDYRSNSSHHLRPGDVLTLEVEIDPAYEPDTYIIQWVSTKQLDGIVSEPKIVIPILDRHVGQTFDVQCRVISKRGWHRLQQGYDDFLFVNFKVLPPIA